MRLKNSFRPNKIRISFKLPRFALLPLIKRFLARNKQINAFNQIILFGHLSYDFSGLVFQSDLPNFILFLQLFLLHCVRERILIPPGRLQPTTRLVDVKHSCLWVFKANVLLLFRVEENVSITKIFDLFLLKFAPHRKTFFHLLFVLQRTLVTETLLRISFQELKIISDIVVYKLFVLVCKHTHCMRTCIEYLSLDRF